MSGSGGFYKYRCKYFLTHDCQNWVFVNNAPCAECCAAGRDDDVAQLPAALATAEMEIGVPMFCDGVLRYTFLDVLVSTEPGDVFSTWTLGQDAAASSRRFLRLEQLQDQQQQRQQLLQQQQQRQLQPPRHLQQQKKQLQLQLQVLQDEEDQKELGPMSRGGGEADMAASSPLHPKLLFPDEHTRLDGLDGFDPVQQSSYTHPPHCPQPQIQPLPQPPLHAPFSLAGPPQLHYQQPQRLRHQPFQQPWPQAPPAAAVLLPLP